MGDAWILSIQFDTMSVEMLVLWVVEVIVTGIVMASWRAEEFEEVEFYFRLN